MCPRAPLGLHAVTVRNGPYRKGRRRGPSARAGRKDPPPTNRTESGVGQDQVSRSSGGVGTPTLVILPLYGPTWEGGPVSGEYPVPEVPGSLVCGASCLRSWLGTPAAWHLGTWALKVVPKPPVPGEAEPGVAHLIGRRAQVPAGLRSTSTVTPWVCRLPCSCVIKTSRQHE